MHSHFHIIGPGGAGKSTTGKILASAYNLHIIDLDEYFLNLYGDISLFIQENNYEDYANKNVSNYLDIIVNISTPSIIVMSSGFMTYPDHVHTSYPIIKSSIEQDPFTILLLPSIEVDECVEILVTRQLQRTYLNIDMEKETSKIKKRFPLFLKLKSNIVLSAAEPIEVAHDIYQLLQSPSADCRHINE